MNAWSDHRRDPAAAAAAQAPSYQMELLDALYNESPISFAVIDRQGRFLDMNRDPTDLFGYSKEEMAGQPFSGVIHDESFDATMQAFRQTLAGERCSLDIRIVHKLGHAVDLNIQTAPLHRRGKKVGILVFLQDISDRKRALERIRYMAYYDDMTGLPNRRSFMGYLDDWLTAADRAGRKLAVCYMDVDRFKLVNSSFGRDFGDMLLMQVAERLTRFFREPGQLARLEGDEFAALITDVSGIEEASLRAQDVMRLFDEPFELSGVPIQVTVSMGLALYEGSGEHSSSLLEKADTALHNVKDNGRNDYSFYTDEMERTDIQKLKLHHELKRALQNREFVLYFQPQYNLATGRIIGLEALVRWQHPDRGLVPPGLFIPAAEESGLIVELGDWVLREACIQNKIWQDAGLPSVPMSVNLSIRQFAQRDLIGRIADVLVQTGLDPRYLELEITESMTMNVERTSRLLQELSGLGVTISIDDFGTGYSSFHYLKNFPIGKLKIDRSFVRDIQQDPNDAAIVAAIIAMAHNLQLQVIAEGVETEDQVRFLRNHLCDEMQGYYGSPPLPKDQIEMLLAGRGRQSAIRLE